MLEKQVKVGSKLSVLSIMGPEVKLMEKGKRIEHQIYNHFQKI